MSLSYEQLGSFYLGKKFDIEKKELTNSYLLYDSKDLVTHAVCLGMTGSGKTGLCLVLLEEAIIDGIPAIMIDPKGDLSNLLLTFPNLDSSDFEQWVNEEDALKNGLDKKEFALKQAELWKSGIKQWNQEPERIRKLRDSVSDITIYTPGSNSGIPVSVLRSFVVPEKEIIEDSELLRERINNTVTGLLALVGIQSNPIESREHILISNIIDYTWKQGKDLDIAAIIESIHNPPFNKIGVLDIESFFPSKDRFQLVMSINNLLASPSFTSWQQGVPLEINNILYDKKGKPRVSIFSIAHLNDNERMFFVTILLNQIISWMRTQTGTTSLRSILYMDEIFGYLPPIANPPSKSPLLTLLKQARAFGLGLVLATQNPVDLDYKALSNAGTWFIGRLQTERDKERVIEGLESISQSDSNPFNKQAIDKMISGLEKRVFLMKNVHEENIEIFQTRWALSYLRGPLDRLQIKSLMDPIRNKLTMDKNNNSDFTYNIKSLEKVQIESDAGLLNKKDIHNTKTDNNNIRIGDTKKQIDDDNISNRRPTLSPDISQFFVTINNHSSNDKVDQYIYSPKIFGYVTINYTDTKIGIDIVKDQAFFTDIKDEPLPIEWTDEKTVDIKLEDLKKEPEINQFSDLPNIATKVEKYRDWEKEFINWLALNCKLKLLMNPILREYSKPEESEKDFLLRIDTIIREKRDSMIEEIREKYRKKLEALDEKLRRAANSVMVEKEQASRQKMDAAISIGVSLLGAFLGKKTTRSSLTYGRTRNTINNVTKSFKEHKDIVKAKETFETLSEKKYDLEDEFKQEITKIDKIMKAKAEKLQEIYIKPDRNDISIKVFSLVWFPEKKS